MKFDIHKKEREGLLYENGTSEKIVSNSKLKLWTIFWGHGECEWPLINVVQIMYVQGWGQLHMYTTTHLQFC